MAGTGSTTSSLTSTSHTLTQTPGIMLSPSDTRPANGFLDVFRSANRHTFLKPPSSVPTESLQAVKATLDAFAGQVADEQQLRLAEAGKKRKRGAGEGRPDVLKIRKLHVDGFETSQIWQQTKRIIASTLAQSKEALSELEASKQVEPLSNGVGETTNGFDSEDEDLDSDGGLVEESDELDSDLLDEMLVDGEDEDAEDTGMFDEEGEDEQDDNEDDEEDDEGNEDDEDDLIRPVEEFIEDPNGLNDGFFSIDEFNKQTQILEDQDARGDPTTDQLTDEEDLDWHADPMAATQPAKKGASKSKKPRKQAPELDAEDAEEEPEEDEEGPAPFGNMDLFAPEGESDDEMDGIDDDQGPDTNNIFYKDFFAPPPKKGKRAQRGPKHSDAPLARPDDDEVERAMADVRRDLFESESEMSDADDGLSDVSAGDPRSRRSAHERRQAKLLDEIRKLEAESVKQKKWTMSGEASGSSRPVNSLLDEDLEFEHAGKPIPVVTQEVSESIEAMIKRRIIDQQFDEVLRRYPTDDTTANTRRGLIEIDDAQAKQGLGDLYAEEHVKNSNPDTYMSKSDEKLKREEKEVEQMWKEVCATLDALSSWHYKPKPVAPSLTVVADVATVAMEDAQPTTAQGVAGGESMMAPQEVYKAGAENAEFGEVVTKSGLPVARQEMTREERARRRRSQKARIRKSGSGAGANGEKKALGKKAQEKKDTLDELKRGGVKVINRKGEVVDIDGNKAKAAKTLSSGNFKL